jgi:two-component system sensor histidine kinase HydH
VSARSSKRAQGGLFSPEMLLLAWAPVAVIGAFHYLTPPHDHAVHDVLRRLYYLPILFAAFAHGVRGGLAIAVVCSLTYAPHAFFVMPTSQDPATTLNKLLEIVLYNAIGGLAGVLADREARRRRDAERALARERKMAEQLVRAGRLAALGELVAGVAHDVKNPLHTIRGTAEIVDEVVPKDAPQAKMWSLLRREIDHLETVADRFLSFARPSAPELTPQAIRSVYERVEELVSAQLRGTAPEMELRVEPLPPDLGNRAVRADRDQIAQIALNIAGNAVTATGGKGWLQLSCSHVDDEDAWWVALRFENDGPVVPGKDLERIFDPFFTGSPTGTGLGLAIAVRIAEAHGGFLAVENTGDERGVAFTLSLPESGCES